MRPSAPLPPNPPSPLPAPPRRGWKALALAGFVGLALAAGCGARHEAPLSIGTNTWVGYEPLYLARDLGLHEGLALRLVELGSTTQAMDALRVGSLDVAGLTLDETLTLLHEGVPISVVWVMNISAGADAVLAQADVPDLASLRGRRIGVEQTALGAYMLDAALRHAGLKAEDVTIVPLPVDEHVSAWSTGAVDALVTFDPPRQMLLDTGARTMFDSRQIPGQIVDVLVARRAALQCCAARIAQLIASQQQALAHLQAQPQDALQRMAPRLGLSPEGVAAALAGMELPDGAANQRLLAGANPPLAQTAGQLMQAMWQQGLLPRQPDLGQLIDDRFTHTSAEQTP